MTRDIDTLIDRKQMRRRLTLWRIAALAFLAIAALAILQLSGALSGTSQSGEHIARVEISGTITTDRNLIALLDGLAKNNNVKAVLLSVNSPGGTAVGGEAIYDAVRRLAKEKPVASSVDTLAASAGYMIAAGADHIVARRASIVGSIGVIFQYPKVDGLLDKVGIEMKEVKSSPLKAEPSPFGVSPPGTEQMLRVFIDDTYNWFVDLVAERRGFEREKALQLANGRVYSGGIGLKNGLIDELGGEREAKAWLVKQAQLDENIALRTWKPRNPNADWPAIFSKTTLGKLANEHFPGIFPKRVFLDGLLAVWHG